MDLLLNGSDNHTNDCHEGPTSHKTLQIVVLIRSGVAGVSFIMSVIACLLIITRQYSRTLGYKLGTSTIKWLFLYLLITSILYSLACVFQFVVILLDSSKPNAPSCQINGFFTIFFNWTFTLMSFCVTLHLLIYSIMHGNIDKRNTWLKRFEVFYLIFTFFGPFLFVFWPFLHGYYGLDGTWCFIHSTSGNCITDIIGVIEQLFVYMVCMEDLTNIVCFNNACIYNLSNYSNEKKKSNNNSFTMLYSSSCYFSRNSYLSESTSFMDY